MKSKMKPKMANNANAKISSKSSGENVSADFLGSDPVQGPVNEYCQHEAVNLSSPANQPRKRKQSKPKDRKSRVLKQKKYLQRTVDDVIAKGPLQRLIRKVIMERSQVTDYRIQSLALEALQASVEMYITQLLEDDYLFTLFTWARRVTLQPEVLKWVKFIRGLEDPANP